MPFRRMLKVKALITRNGNSEHIWVEVDRISTGKIEGRLANEPVDLGDLKLDSKVEVETSQVEDWAYSRGSETVGQFTVPVLLEIEEQRSGKK